MKKIKQIIRITKKYNIVVIGVLLWILSFVQMFLFAFLGVPTEILSMIPIFNGLVLWFILDIKIILKLYVIYRFSRKKLAKK